MMATLETFLAPHGLWCHVTGSVEDRVILVGEEALSGHLLSFGVPVSVLRNIHSNKLTLSPTSEFVSHFLLTGAQKHRLVRPRVSIIALYHPENFPLPRFALGISDIARSLRSDFAGVTELYDMQLGMPVEQIVQKVKAFSPDIVGFSATFGQHDVLVQALDLLRRDCDTTPLIIVGGSLGSLNRDVLLREHGVDFVGTGAGEGTMRGVASYWHGMLDAMSIPDVSFLDKTQSSQPIKTAKTNNRAQEDIMPEFDLARETLSAGGVMQLESSRGCSYACSFCPREHKGIWAGEDASALTMLIPELDELYAQFPHIDRRIFLVDEEFIGYQPDDQALSRCMKFAETMKKYRFRFETSSRIDQVSRRNRDTAWHLRRMEFWRGLKDNGLSRCLFGVESGVDSILERFNKKITSQQSALALRILTALQIPIRCTYITFDPLMTLDELKDTYVFLGRKDIVLRDLRNFENDEIFSIVTNDHHSREAQSGAPFYSLVSYMLVSMESLTGSPYLAEVERRGLAGAFNPLMGRREVRYLDGRIGALSEASQRWVDRNFSLDYTLKSIEKVMPDDTRAAVREARIALKNSAYELLGAGLQAIEASGAGANVTTREFEVFDEDDLDRRFEELIASIDPFVAAARQSIGREFSDRLDVEYERWKLKNGWLLINGVCE
ncbi:B12-binding domain-containing radical SAM protein [Burkholderia cepacia]|uniref:B12-binding domain-containing radical SAM protein n=1 Tax=Burkholderia cepacia TaxID=292 RepID=UPI001589654E|nr:cobalamin-dependent protein [Burkholderia cepacia]